MKKHAIALLTALLAGTVLHGNAASAETAKHERVYVVVNHDGEVQTLLDNVHLENGDALNVLSDRSTLSEIENVGGHEIFTLDGEALTWQANGSSIIYQAHRISVRTFCRRLPLCWTARRQPPRISKMRRAL